MKVRLRTIPSTIRVGSKIHYVRYADDWVIGVVGNRELAKEIRELIRSFLEKELKLELSMEKTKITHLSTEYAKFLGHYVKTMSRKEGDNSRRVNKLNNVTDIRKSGGRKPPKIMIPLDILKNQLISKGFANKEGKPKYVGKFIYLSDYEIVQRYNSVIRGYMNFYNMAENRSKLGDLIYILEYSLIHTLAAKHRTEVRKIFTKYGQPIRVTVNTPKGVKIIKFDKPESLKASYLNEKYSRLDTSKIQEQDPCHP